MGKTKYIFITGGVVSGLGKGITAASLGRLLKSRGLKVTAQKLDPYLNVDPGTMNPVQHGEVFVTDDGAETDLDLGHYERFIDESLSQNSNLTSGRVYWKVITDERKGVYGGQTIQIIPHVTNEIKRSISRNADTGADVCLVEIGGTVGDIESQPFLEAIRQFAVEAGRENCLFIHVTLVPYLAASDELKSKPTQHSVKEMLSIGINPDIIVCRTEHPLTDEIKHKISLFCNVDPECVIENNNCDILYAVPIMLHQQHMDDVVIRKLGIDCPGAPDLADWQEMHGRAAPPGTDGQNRSGGQICGAARQLYQRQRGAEARRHCHPQRRGYSLDRLGDPGGRRCGFGRHLGRYGRHFGTRRLWLPWHRRQNQRLAATPAPTECPTWESAWVCRLQLLNLPGMCWAWRTPTRQRSTRPPPTR